MIVIDPKRRWAADPAEQSVVRRNGFYVAVSRARHGLSVIAEPACRWADGPTLAPLIECVGDPATADR